MIGKKVIVRCTEGSVFFGTLVEKNGTEVKLENARRLWYWSGACSTFQISAEGVKNPDACKFTVVVPSIQVMNVGEILPCSAKAVENIESVPVWKK